MTVTIVYTVHGTRYVWERKNMQPGGADSSVTYLDKYVPGYEPCFTDLKKETAWKARRR